MGSRMEERVDCGQIIKMYAAPTAEEQRRCSPSRLAEIRKTDVYGDPNRDKICTSHVERQNGSTRQCCKRLTRVTYVFSKKWENLKAALALHFAYYNFCRVHRTIKKTPAIAAGITNRAWTLGELLAA